MVASEKQAGKAVRTEADMSSDRAISTLTRTLEDLEARLGRLSKVKRETQVQPVREGEPSDDSAQSAARRRSESHLSKASDIAMGASGTGEAASRRRPAAERRIGTLAGEVEALRLQGTTLEAVSGIAGDIQSLKAEIAQAISASSQAGFRDIRATIEDLGERISTTDQGGAVADQLASLMRRLSEMQAGGSDVGALAALRSDLERISALAAEAAREETVASAAKRWEDFEARLEAHVELDGAARRNLQGELERLRQVVRSLATEEQVRAVEKRWDEFEARHFETLRAQQDGELGEVLRGELDRLGERIEALARVQAATREGEAQQRDERGAADARIAEILSRLTVRFEELEDAFLDLPAILGVSRLEERLQSLSDGVAQMLEQQRGPELDHFLILEERLDEISDAIVASSLQAQPTIDMGPVERIEARVADLAARLDRMAVSGDTDALSERIAELSARIEALASAQGGDDLDERLEDFSVRIETALSRIEAPQAAAVEFEERLSALAERLEAVATARVDDDLLRSLQAQIEGLGAQLSSRAPVGGAPADDELAERLSAIERRIEENRADVMAAARAAADEAVRLLREDGESRDGEHVRDLSEDLRSLEALCRETDDRSIRVFEAVHATLVKIADRLTTIEGEIRDGAERAVVAAPAPEPSATPVAPMPALEAVASGEPVPEVEEAPRRGLRAAIARHLGRGPREEAVEAEPVLDPVAPDAPMAEVQTARASIADAPPLDAEDSILSREANRPLEPGSGAPDIASLIERVRAQHQRAGAATDPAAKADFIAAARKAALAAAAEAESLRRDVAEDGAGRDVDSARRGRHRKPVLMAVGAVLLALTAIPLGRMVIDHLPAEDSTGTERVAAGAAEPVSATAIAAAEPEAASPSEQAEAAIVKEGPDIALPTRSALPSPTTGSSRTLAAVRSSDAANPPSIAALAAERASGSVDSSVQTASLASRTQPAVMASPEQDPAADAEAVRMAEETAPAGRSDPELIERALSRLPVAAQGDLPSTPSAIGPTALVAASDAGDPRAIFEIGLRLMEGRGGEGRTGEALVWFAHSAKLGYAPAQYSLGTLFEKGNGVERDTVAARDWYTLAANQGNVRAMHNLAVLYATGIEGVSQPETAAEWFTRAAEHGMRDSQYNLGILHARGAGVPQDFAQSYKWFSIVGQSGDSDAIEKRDEVAKTLSADEIAVLDAEVEAWTPTARIESANSVDVPASWSEEAEQTASVDMKRAVRNVQAILIKLGFDPGAPDGVIGERTTQAVRAFQEENGLSVTGKVDEALIRELLKRNV